MQIMTSVVVPSFVESWRYAGWTSFQESAAGGSIDTFGNLVLCGKSRGLAFSIDDDTSTTTVSADFSAVKIQGTSGEELWTWEDSSDSGADWMVSAATDGENNIILGGFTGGQWGNVSNFDGYRDIAAVKLSGSDGAELWRYQVASSTSELLGRGGYGISYVRGVAVGDRENDPVLVGTTQNSLVDGVGEPGDWDFFAIKLDGATGDELWRMQGGSPFLREGLRGVKMDPAGDLVAAGYSTDEDTGEDVNFMVVKLSGLDGTTMWTYATNTTTGDVLHSVDLDERGNVFVAGAEGAPNFQGKIGTAPVVIKINGNNGAEMWAYRGEGGDRITFNSVAADPRTGWVVGAGGTRGAWVPGASQGGFDFAAVVLDGDSGDELTRWQNGTVGDDIIEFAEFDPDGALFFGGFSSAAWEGGAGDEDVIAIKFEPLATTVPVTEAPSPAPTSAPTLAPSPSPTPSLTPGPVAPAPTPSPTVASRDIPSSPAPTSGGSTTASVTTAGVEDSSPVLEQWAVGSIVAAAGFMMILIALCLCSLRRRAKAKMAEIAAANERAQRVVPVPSTKPQHMAFVDIYHSDSDESKFTSEDVGRSPAYVGTNLPRAGTGMA